MTHPAHTEQFLRQRRFYLALPLLALPFLTLIYWKLVVKNLERHPGQHDQATGLQLSLPSADLSDEQGLDKLAYYQKADRDSVSWAQQIKKDPYRQNQQQPAMASAGSALMGLGAPEGALRAGEEIPAKTEDRTSAEKKIHQRLRALDKALSSAHSPSPDSRLNGDDLTAEEDPQIARLEKMMTQMQTDTVARDPEMVQLDGMLDKLLQLQEREKNIPEKAEGAASAPALAVSSLAPEEQITLLTASADSAALKLPDSQQAAFFGLDQDSAAQPAAPLTAVIERTQQLVSGATVQLRLTSPLSVTGVRIAENTLIYGTAALAGERLKIKISSLRAGEQILTVSLSVYDLDGIEGIYIPGALPRSVVKQQLASQIQGYDLDTSPLSVGAQAAAAGMQVGQMLLSKKSRLTQVTLSQGYKVLLHQTNTTHP